MKNVVTIVQIVLSIFLLLSILLQSRGAGLSSSFGGGGEFYRSRRGIERVLLRITVVLAILFLASSVANILVK